MENWKVGVMVGLAGALALWLVYELPWEVPAIVAVGLTLGWGISKLLESLS